MKIEKKLKMFFAALLMVTGFCAWAIEPTEIELEIIEELNLARANPRAYYDNYVSTKRGEYSDEYMDSCQTDMYNSPKLQPLSFRMGLFMCAKEHSGSGGPIGAFGHTRIDGRSFGDAIREYGSYRSCGENISYGSSTARDIVIQLLVDDGTPSLGHRYAILNGTYDTVGVGVDTHLTYRCECVMDFGYGWVDASWIKKEYGEPPYNFNTKSEESTGSGKKAKPQPKSDSEKKDDSSNSNSNNSNSSDNSQDEKSTISGKTKPKPKAK